MEVLHGDIRITLSDQEAIRGLQRTRAQLKREVRAMSREKATFTIEADVRELDKALIKARRDLKKFEGERAEGKLDLNPEEANRELRRLNKEIEIWAGRKASKEIELQGARDALNDLHRMQVEEEKLQVIQEKRAAARAKAAAQQKRIDDAEERRIQATGRMQVQAMRMDEDRTRKLQRQGSEVAALQKQYDKLNVSLQRLRKNNAPKFYTGPEERMRFELDERHITEQMLILRERLKAMNARPIEIPVDIDEKNALAKLAGIGGIGTRIGPFSGTLKEFTRAGLILGPIITGLVGSITALAGAIGTGLTGAVGIAATGLVGFGLTLGGVGALTVSLFRDFKNLNTLQDAYHKQVLKTGAGSEKAKTKLAEFNHALGEVTPTTRAAFLALNGLQDRWRGLRKDVRPDFMNTLGEAITTVNADFGVFSRETKRAFGVVTQGIQGWLKGLRTGEAQQTIFTIMRNTTDSIPPLLEGLGHLGAALGRVTASFSRHFRPLLQDFDDWAGGLDHASQRTDHLNTGVDHLVGSFRSVMGVMSAFSRVIIEMSRAAMGPGGAFLDDIAGGLNDIAQTIHDNPQPLRDFFGESIGTTKALYGVLQPLVALFMEFSTILRPATNAVLSIVGPIADLVQAMAGFGPIRGILQAMATMWLFKRTFANNIIFLTGAVRDLSGALRGAAASTAAAGFGRTASALSAASRIVPAPIARTAPVVGRGGAPVTYAGRNVVTTTPGVVGPVSRGVSAAAPVAREGGALMRGAGLVTKGLGALSMGLLGVSGPVALLGGAAIGAAIGIKKLRDRANERSAEEQHARQVLKDPNAIPDRGQFIRDQFAQSAQAARARGGPAVANFDPEVWERNRKAAIAAADAIEFVNARLREAGQLQRDLVGIGSQLQNSHLMVEQAEKAYGDAVKQSGKKSLEARMALQQLRDARAQESQASRAWGEQASQAGTLVARAVDRAQKAFNQARGTRFEDDMARRLDSAKNSAAAFEINVRRAKKGVDIFTGEGSEKIGALVRQFGTIPGLKRTLIRVDTQEAALKIGEVVKTLSALGQGRTIARILADAKNPREALKELNAALDRWENRHPVAELRADRNQAEHELNNANKQLSMYGARKPQAALRARDEAQAKLDRLNKQLDALDGKKATVTANVKFTLPHDFQTDAGSGGYGGQGDGQGVPNIGGAVKGFAQKHANTLSNMFLGGGGLGNATAMGSGLNAFNGIAQRFGLTVGSGFRPGAITSSGNTSYHALGRARDFPGPPGAMMAFAKFMARTFGSRLKELIYTPLGWSIKNGQRVPPYAQAEHYNHVHVAMAKGGERPRPGKYSQPAVLFAEEPNHPEYFISTNPRDKKRSRRLIAQAAADVGMVEHSPVFNAMTAASGGARGLGALKIGGKKLTREQQGILQTAVAMSKALGAGGRATRALIAALFAESGAKNLKYGDASSTGPLQLLASTAKGLHVNPRNVKAVIKLFLTKGFTGKGGAIKLARGNKKLSAAQIATMVQGNRDGASTYAPFVKTAARVLSAVGGVGGGFSGGGGGTNEIPVMGPHNTLSNRIAGAQGRLDLAAQTQGNYAGIINAIYGRTRTVNPPGGPNAASGVGTLGHPGTGRPGIKRVVHQPGMIGLLRKQNKAAHSRLADIQEKLAGKLTPSRRRELLAEQEQLTGTITGNRTKINDLRDQGAEARFERRMGTGQGGTGNRLQIDRMKAVAEGTPDQADDTKALEAEAAYYKARAAWAKKRGDKAGETEAITAYNAATQSLQDLTRSNAEGWLTYAEGQASMTGSLNDDLSAMNASLAYWQTRMNDAQAAGDTQGFFAASANVQQYTERVNGLKEDMARLPLERDRALAALTEDTTDDVKATTALRDYWKTRLDTATASGDLAGQIEAAGNVKSLNDELNQAQNNIVQQMVNLNNARLDLFKSFASNNISTLPAGFAVGSQNAGTTVNLTVNGAEIGPDPFTWSNNVAWEIQAAV